MFSAASKLFSGLFVFFQIIISLVIIGVIIYVAFYIATVARVRIKNKLYERRLPELIQKARNSICSALRDMNNKLSDDNSITRDTWSLISSQIDKIEKAGYLLDDLEQVEGQKVPCTVWKIFLEWENDIQPMNMLLPERKKRIRESASKKIREQLLFELDQYRKMRNLRAQINRKNIFITDR